MKNLFIILFSSLTVLCLSIFLEWIIDGPKGVVTGIAEVSLELLALFIVAFKYKKYFGIYQYYFLLTYLSFICLGDLFYMYYYYFLALGTPTLKISLFTTAPYTIGVLAVVLFLGSSFKEKIIKSLFNPIAIIPVVVLTPIAFTLASPLFLDTSMENAYLYLEIASLLTTYVLFVVSFVVYITSREVFWSLFSSGILMLMLASWSIKVEKFSHHSVRFVVYEFIWLFGMSLSILTLYFSKPSSKKIPSYDVKSIALNGRLLSVLLSLVMVTLIIVVQNDIELVRFVAVSLCVTILGSAFLAQMHFQQFKAFDDSVKYLIGHARPDFSFDSIGSQLPSELRDSYFLILEKNSTDIRKIENSRSDQRIAELSKQVSHDIRSPLSALSMAVSSLDGLSEDRRIIIRNATNRIRDIANALQFEKNQNQNSQR